MVELSFFVVRPTSMLGQYIRPLYRPSNSSATSKRISSDFHWKHPRSFQTKLSIRPFTQGAIAVYWSTTWDAIETWFYSTRVVVILPSTSREHSWVIGGRAYFIYEIGHALEVDIWRVKSYHQSDSSKWLRWLNYHSLWWDIDDV